jgi:hypothetical protein
MAGETTGEPRTAWYEDLLLSLLLLHVNRQRVSHEDDAGEDLLIAGVDSAGNLLDQVFGHALGLLQDLGCHVEWWRGRRDGGKMLDGMRVVVMMVGSC